jgi:5-methylcytosine-specific restriction enzyme A
MPMALLYYWRGDNYRRDLDEGAGYQLNQGNPLLHEIPIGDSLWAFTRRRDGAYALAAELVVTAKTLNPPGYRYGRYRVWGDLTVSRYFVTEYQPDITPLVRSLSLTAKGDTLGRAFQGHAAVRKINAADDRVLRAYAVGLEFDSRATLVPEERLEDLLLAGDARSVEALIRDEPSGISEERAHYLMTEAVARNRQFVESLRETYFGRCQICTWAPRSIYRTDLCEAHHVRWLGRGGDDRLSNMVLLCPNHHRAVHRLDAPFDWDALSFAFAEKSEPLQLLKHDLEAS